MVYMNHNEAYSADYLASILKSLGAKPGQAFS